MLHNLEILMFKDLCEIKKYCNYKYGHLSRREVKSYSASHIGGTESSSRLLDHSFSVTKTFTGIPAVFPSVSLYVGFILEAESLSPENPTPHYFSHESE